MHTLNLTEAALALRDRDPEGGRVLAEHRWNHTAGHQAENPSPGPAILIPFALGALFLAFLQDRR